MRFSQIQVFVEPVLGINKDGLCYMWLLLPAVFHKNQFSALNEGKVVGYLRILDIYPDVETVTSVKTVT